MPSLSVKKNVVIWESGHDTCHVKTFNLLTISSKEIYKPNFIPNSQISSLPHFFYLFYCFDLQAKGCNIKWANFMLRNLKKVPYSPKICSIHWRNFLFYNFPKLYNYLLFLVTISQNMSPMRYYFEGLNMFMD